MPRNHIRIEYKIDFPCTIGTLQELFPEDTTEEDADTGFADFLDIDEEVIVY